jgi:hypothetical protein
MKLKKDSPASEESVRPELEQRVDAMMSTEGALTAPQLPTQLLKTIGKQNAKSSLKIIKDTSAEPEPAGPSDTSEPEPESEPEPALVPKPLVEDPLADDDTDQAVRAIVAEEADMQLAVIDAVARQKTAAVSERGPGLLHGFFASPWTWLFIIGIAAVTYAWYH